MKKRTCALLMVFVLSAAFLLSGCGSIDQSDIVGTWEGTGYHSGSTYEYTVAFLDDGTCGEVIYKDGSLDDIKSGTYVIEGKKVSATYKGGIGTTPYNYKNGKLYNGDDEFHKIK